jgi:hypothetical protein
MATIWIEDRQGRRESFNVPLTGERREIEGLARGFIPMLIAESGMQGLKAWGIVDSRARVRR